MGGGRGMADVGCTSGSEVRYHFTVFFACASVIFSLSLSVTFFRWL